MNSLKRHCLLRSFCIHKYNPSVDFEWEKIDQIKAIKLLLDQSWISPTNGSAEILLGQLSQWSFYLLTYSNNQRAIEAIANLFDHD